MRFVSYKHYAKKPLLAIWMMALCLVSAEDVELKDLLSKSVFSAGGLWQVQKIVKIQQVEWELSNMEGELKCDSYGWGQISVDPKSVKDLLKKTERDPSKPTYINVIGKKRGKVPVWLVENLRMPGVPCGSNFKEHFEKNSAPMAEYFPILNWKGTPQTVPIEKLQLKVVFSNDAIPVLPEALDYIYGDEDMFGKFLNHKVIQIKESTQGIEDDKLPELKDCKLSPPRAIDFKDYIDSDSDLVSPLYHIQDPFPNIQCARNQCVPCAYANILQYLEDQNDGLIDFLKWNIPDDFNRGYGKTTDNVNWTPVTSDDPLDSSLIAQIDAYSQRKDTTDFNSGGGTGRCRSYSGLFKYLNGRAKANFAHQGGELMYGYGSGVDNCQDAASGPDQVSYRHSEKPTWLWIYNELAKGNGVYISFKRYNAMGERTSGHAVRVYGASRYGKNHYLYTLDDSPQGDDGNNENTGLRTQSWDVKDTGNSSGGDNPGTPDGFMNMNGLDWEITFAQSIEKVPSLNFKQLPLP